MGTDPVSVSVSVSAQDGIVALGKAHTRSAPSNEGIEANYGAAEADALPPGQQGN